LLARRPSFDGDSMEWKPSGTNENGAGKIPRRPQIFD
jgi:hypothetical protein